MSLTSENSGAPGDEVTARLRECFQSVFPDLSAEQVDAAVRTEIQEWDSLATLTLLTVVDEEFGLQLDDEQIARFNSFASVRAIVDAGV